MNTNWICEINTCMTPLYDQTTSQLGLVEFSSTSLKKRFQPQTTWTFSSPRLKHLEPLVLTRACRAWWAHACVHAWQDATPATSTPYKAGLPPWETNLYLASKTISWTPREMFIVNLNEKFACGGIFYYIANWRLHSQGSKYQNCSYHFFFK